MKHLLLATAISFSLIACNNTPKGDEAQTGEAVSPAATTTAGTPYSVDTTSSTVTWAGSKKTGGGHTGAVKISEGTLFAADTALNGGTFTIDMNSIVNHDIVDNAESKARLEGHLKSADFFDVEKFGTAKFEITNVEPLAAGANSTLQGATHTIAGNLTLKDTTQNISFPAKITNNGNTINAVADFNIDRSTFNVNYKGPNNPQDWVINKDVNLKIDLTANKN